MPSLGSPLSTPAGMPTINPSHVGKQAGGGIHFPTMAAFTAAITVGQTGYAADLWANGQPLTISGEPIVAKRFWNGTHARTVLIGMLPFTLAGNANVVDVTSGAPASNSGANGDLRVDMATGLVYQKANNAWGSGQFAFPVSGGNSSPSPAPAPSPSPAPAPAGSPVPLRFASLGGNVAETGDASAYTYHAAGGNYMSGNDCHGTGKLLASGTAGYFGATHHNANGGHGGAIGLAVSETAGDANSWLYGLHSMNNTDGSTWLAVEVNGQFVVGQSGQDGVADDVAGPNETNYRIRTVMTSGTMAVIFEFDDDAAFGSPTVLYAATGQALADLHPRMAIQNEGYVVNPRGLNLT